MTTFLNAFWQDESGQDLAEYGLLLALIALGAALAVVALGTAVANLWTSNATEFSEAVSGGD